MEHKHFSHPHGLTFHQNTLKSEANCSGCKFPCSSKTFVCWECNFFLHERCFHATRFIDHPSHQTHPLTLALSPTYPSGRFICNHCNKPGFGFSYSCSKCDYNLHLHCSNINLESSTTSTSSPSLKPINHKSHPQHILCFLSSPPYDGGIFICSACGKDGKASVYNCSVCEFDLHEKCAALPETMKRNDHVHSLVLKHSAPDQYTCDVCWRSICGGLWMYCCEECDYGTHVDCVKAKARSQAEVALEQNLAAQVELMRIQNMVNLNGMKADIIGNAFYGHRHYRY